MARSTWSPKPLVVDCAMWAVGLSAGVIARYEFELPAGALASLVGAVLAAITLQVLITYVVYRVAPRPFYGSFEEILSAAVIVLLVATVLLSAIVMMPKHSVPASAPVIGAFVTLVLMLGVRYVVRVSRENRMRPDPAESEPILLFGAGEAGAQLARTMLRRPDSRYLPVGFLDDDPRLHRHVVGGVKVLGSRSDLRAAVASTTAKGIVCSVARADAPLIRDLNRLSLEVGIWIKVVPSVAELLDGQVGISDIRDVNIDDILGRHQVETDISAISGYLTGRRVLVTGAGGSIGSELCRQLRRLDPAELMLLDRDESALHSTLMSLYGKAELNSPDVLLADIRDRARLDAIFSERRPEVVFHAAALKHVALLEQYPGEATQSNVWGTLNVLEAAAAAGVEKFVNISTDKAADPVNVLGYSKRITERLTAGIAERETRNYLSVRFGNVLGSRGSVLTTFAGQIAQGLPLTVTDRDVTRYFMTIAEAVQLVIQAGAVGLAGEALVLDMGKPVRIDDVARQMAASASRKVAIVYTGLTSGEKLHEVLLGSDEIDSRPTHPLISQVRVPTLGADSVLALNPWAPQEEVLTHLRALCNRPNDRFDALKIPGQPVRLKIVAAPVGISA